MIRRLAAGVLLLVVCAGFVSAQSSTPAQTQPPRATSRPYSGDLSIFDYPDRDKKLQINRVMDLLGITAGKNVGDLGAGSGWFTVIASKRVGTTGAVLAEDINPIAIEYIGKRVKKEGIENVRTVLGTADDPGFPAGSLDAVLMLKVYHEIAHPVTAMKKLKPALRSGSEGRDHRQKRQRLGPRSEPGRGGEGDGRDGIHTGGSVRLHEAGRRGLLPDLQGKVTDGAEVRSISASTSSAAPSNFALFSKRHPTLPSPPKRHPERRRALFARRSRRTPKVYTHHSSSDLSTTNGRDSTQGRRRNTRSSPHMFVVYQYQRRGTVQPREWVSVHFLWLPALT